MKVSSPAIELSYSDLRSSPRNLARPGFTLVKAELGESMSAALTWSVESRSKVLMGARTRAALWGLRAF
jgi:hypothetical protein